MTQLSLVGVSKIFGNAKVVDTVSITVEPGKVHVLLGENGAGKSTVIKMMSGIYQPDEGHIEIDGKQLVIPNVDAARKLGIAVIHQELNMVPGLSIMENLFLGDLPTKAGFVDRATMKRRARAALERIGLNEDVSTPMNALGVARQQMVEIAKALMQDASILILDEPTASLTRKECDQLFTIMDELKAKGVAMVFISHHLDEIARVGDVVTVLRDGKYVGTIPASSPESELVRMMVGRNIDNQYPRTAGKPGEVMLSVQGLTRHGAINDVSFDVKAGEVVGLAGLVGAGRTEVLRAIFGADTYDSGTIMVDGTVVPKGNIAKTIDAGVGLVPEDRRNQGLIMEASVAENLGLATMIPTSKAGFVDRVGQRRREQDTAKKLNIRMAGIDQRTGSLSGGNQQKIVFGKWSMAHVKVLLLDEPTRGVDVGARVEIYELINRVTAQGGAVVMASSDLPEVLGMSDRVLVMSNGHLSGAMPAAEATQEKVMSLAVSHMREADEPEMESVKESSNE
ncbi:sugar ABC transporter ATP-binding protein [Bifidobacterium mongoliense]|jgi:ribose transport system ATP-binding protein|uniref:D-ribose transporter ATP binding protein n=1 Tax=Bifidobacterium mongoliense DSM 21395 TaxID=1437603 RepID=A0A087C7I1_9BIFI|nr:sugar ABC transporter ATP-binding protein [Bifidobacterium mongoliense]KFI79231.1 D-ribose transporter ATP binding protein [Bifidobacterium mongoliense DSM 21395]MDN5633348.1 sugar ABC transporter ATP-binding protein [Bifidobacterium mongoliense]